MKNAGGYGRVGPLPELQLREGWWRTPTALDVLAVARVMLWPSPSPAETRAVSAKIFDIGVKAGTLGAPASLEDLDALAAIPKMTEVESDVMDAAKKGTIAGFLLLRMVRAARKGEAVSMESAKIDLASFYVAKFNERVSLKSIDNNIWPKYRRVSHLWAAWLDYMRAARVPVDRASDLPHFLSAAQWFLRQGLAVTPNQSKYGTVLKAGQIVAIPWADELPPVNP